MASNTKVDAFGVVICDTPKEMRKTHGGNFGTKLISESQKIPIPRDSRAGAKLDPIHRKNMMN